MPAAKITGVATSGWFLGFFEPWDLCRTVGGADLRVGGVAPMRRTSRTNRPLARGRSWSRTRSAIVPLPADSLGLWPESANGSPASGPQRARRRGM